MATLKERLIKKINETDDQNTLEEVYRLLNINFDDEVYILSEEQRSAVNEGLEQIKNGQYLTSEEAHKQTEEWLKESHLVSKNTAGQVENPRILD